MASNAPLAADISSMRKPYMGEQETFKEDDLIALEPFANFDHWFKVACETKEILEANAVSLATATKEGRPSVRVILLKGYDKNGFKFFTNYDSRKGQELTENPHAALCFHWTKTAGENGNWSRQVRIEGRVERISVEESTSYFHSRPRPSQIGACISNQSQVISGRKVLADREKEFQDKYSNESKPIPKPDYWGGFRLIPELFEFWQGQTTRIHDRIIFRKPKTGENINPELTHIGSEGWVYERLSP